MPGETVGMAKPPGGVGKSKKKRTGAALEENLVNDTPSSRELLARHPPCAQGEPWASLSTYPTAASGASTSHRRATSSK